MVRRPVDLPGSGISEDANEWNKKPCNNICSLGASHLQINHANVTRWEVVRCCHQWHPQLNILPHTESVRVIEKWNLPKLKLADFSDDLIGIAWVHAWNIGTSLEMYHLKTLVNGIAKEVKAGLGYTGHMYDVAWNTLVAHFGIPHVVVNAQLRLILTFPHVNTYNSVALVKTLD